MRNLYGAFPIVAIAMTVFAFFGCQLNQSPITPSNPNPFDGATDVSLNPELSWSSSDPDKDFVVYDVYFGTDPNPKLVEENLPYKKYQPGTLEYGKTYYWKVVAKDWKGGSSEGPVWKFTTRTLPPLPLDPNPPDGEFEVSTDVKLTWKCNYAGEDELSYDLYIGKDNPPPLVVRNLKDEEYKPENLEPNTTYYWKIRVKNTDGEITDGPVWKFRTKIETTFFNGFKIATTVNVPGSAYGVSAFKNYVYIASKDYFSILDISSLTNVKILSSINTPGHVYDLHIAGNYAYIADGGYFTIVNVEDPNNPIVTSSISLSGDSRRLVVAGNYAFIASLDHLEIVDISDPKKPKKVSEMKIPAIDVEVKENYAYVVDGQKHFYIVDISDPYDPKVISTVITNGSAIGILIYLNYAYINEGDGITIIDISNKKSPEIIKKISDSTCYAMKGMYLSNEYIYLACENYFRVVDIGNPINPQFRDEVYTKFDHVTDIVGTSDTILLTSSKGQLMIITPK